MRSLSADNCKLRFVMARRLAVPLANWEKFTRDAAMLGLEDFARRETLGLAEYFLRFLNTRDPVWWDLYVGERLKQCHLPQQSLKQLLERRGAVLREDCDYLKDLPPRNGMPGDSNWLEQLFNVTIAAVTDPNMRECRVLLVGDCLFLDLFSFLSGPLAIDGITLRPTYLNNKNPSLLQAELRDAASDKFDLVCYSPYSYEFNLYLSQTHFTRGLLMTPNQVRRLSDSAHRSTAPILELIEQLFECPIYVHNAANFRRHDGSLRSQAKNLATRPCRAAAARRVNFLLAELIAGRKRDCARPPILIDEQALLHSAGDLALGRIFHDSGAFHPTVFSRTLASLYRDLIRSCARLTGKKVVVTDLDNTLWSGAIGEGAVAHDRRRQQMLVELKHKGILLAIASKNDPANISWNGAVLNERDFVATQINWGSKSRSLKLIAEELNLKLKDFVFLDDRADERELVRQALPEVTILDASAEDAWRMLDWWASALPSQADGDRTRLYRERRQRQQYISNAAEPLETEKLLSSLQLRVSIGPATEAALPRIVELVNRTNQFNTCGSRSTLAEMAARQRSSQHLILTAEAADKFGAMGLISAMVVELGAGAFEVSLWVLSCRVFGYGIEAAMLNYLKQLATKSSSTLIRGTIIETPANGPCRNVYRRNGFEWIDGKWECAAASPVINVKWLAVTESTLSI